jgi:hypothetical protein
MSACKILGRLFVDRSACRSRSKKKWSIQFQINGSFCQAFAMRLLWVIELKSRHLFTLTIGVGERQPQSVVYEIFEIL